MKSLFLKSSDLIALLIYATLSILGVAWIMTLDASMISKFGIVLFVFYGIPGIISLVMRYSEQKTIF